MVSVGLDKEEDDDNDMDEAWAAKLTPPCRLSANAVIRATCT